VRRSITFVINAATTDPGLCRSAKSGCEAESCAASAWRSDAGCLGRVSLRLRSELQRFNIQHRRQKARCATVLI
jgi:hypothetical protein